jgi:hypothetical protein
VRARAASPPYRVCRTVPPNPLQQASGRGGCDGIADPISATAAAPREALLASAAPLGMGWIARFQPPAGRREGGDPSPGKARRSPLHAPSSLHLRHPAHGPSLRFSVSLCLCGSRPRQTSAGHGLDRFGLPSARQRFPILAMNPMPSGDRSRGRGCPGQTLRSWLAGTQSGPPYRTPLSQSLMLAINPMPSGRPAAGVPRSVSGLQALAGRLTLPAKAAA